jgi:hypothetical protein
LGECASVYKNNPRTIEELQQEISAAVISVSEETLAAVVRDFRRRLWIVLDADGANIEKFLRDCQFPKTTELRDKKYCDVCCVVR